ncbi:hypothetical protein ACFV0L_40100 [Streptosporangium canum]|uniref:hypothetical protein n=1 Tax=Streptosporangium canum TaxID=324952 RepID=UPI00368CA869
MALRARIASECAQGHANLAVAARLGVARGDGDQVAGPIRPATFDTPTLIGSTAHLT